MLTAVDDAGADYGRVDDGHGEKVMVEFVSANPTGPMTIGNARGGVLGDAHVKTGREVVKGSMTVGRLDEPLVARVRLRFHQISR